MVIKKSFIRHLGYFIITFLMIFMFVLSIGFKRDSPNIGDIEYLNEMYVSINNSEFTKTSLPRKFENLFPKTPVIFKATIYPKTYDGVYIKSRYAQANVYLDDKLVFTFGKKENYPYFMINPASEIHIVETFGTGKPMDLTIEYLSPKTDDFLIVEAPMVGSTKELMLERSVHYGFSMIFSFAQIIGGIASIIISLCIIPVDKKGILFSWLGLFSLSTGAWFLGSNDFALTIFPDTTFLYLSSCFGFIFFMISLLRFIDGIIEFENHSIILCIEIFLLFSSITVLILQFFKLVSLYNSKIFFQIIFPPILVFLTFIVISEYTNVKNLHIIWIIFPLCVLSVSLICEIISQHFSIVPHSFPPFQVGVLFFLFVVGIVSGLAIKSSINLKQKEKELAYEKKILDMRTNEQRENSLLLVENEKLISRQRHDLKHHLAVISDMADDNNKELKSYINNLIQQIPSSKVKFCDNIIVNTVISHYAAICKSENIDFSAKLLVPETKNQKLDSDLCVVFSNLLENAVEACKRMDNEYKFIKIASNIHFDLLTITMDNSYNGVVVKEGDQYRSSKRDDFGIGLSSIQSIAQSRKGNVSFKHDDIIFYSSVYFKIK